MSYAIVGFGKIGQALARAFARKDIEVTVASRRPPEALAPEARAIGPTLVAKSLLDAPRDRSVTPRGSRESGPSGSGQHPRATRRSEDEARRHLGDGHSSAYVRRFCQPR